MLAFELLNIGERTAGHWRTGRRTNREMSAFRPECGVEVVWVVGGWRIEHRENPNYTPFLQEVTDAIVTLIASSTSNSEEKPLV